MKLNNIGVDEAILNIVPYLFRVDSFNDDASYGTIDENGNLINADRMDVPGKNLLFGDGENDDIATKNLREELFNSENVIIGINKESDYGLKEILGRQNK